MKKKRGSYKKRWIKEGRRIERESYPPYSFVAEFDPEYNTWLFANLKGFKFVSIVPRSDDGEVYFFSLAVKK